mgnify:FL=1
MQIDKKEFYYWIVKKNCHSYPVDAKETLINTFLPFFKMSSKTQTRTFLKMAKRTLRFNQLFPKELDFSRSVSPFCCELRLLICY